MGLHKRLVLEVGSILQAPLGSISFGLGKNLARPLGIFLQMKLFGFLPGLLDKLDIARIGYTGGKRDLGQALGPSFGLTEGEWFLFVAATRLGQAY